MLTPISYAVPTNGIVGGSSSSAYWWGKDGQNMRKFANGTAIAEAGWLSGFGAGVLSLLGSNLPVPALARYFGVTTITRFGANPTPSLMFFGVSGKSKAVFPGDTSWRMTI